MATAIKAIPTLKGKEAREFLRHAEEAERNYKGTNNRDDHSFCQMAHAISNDSIRIYDLPRSRRDYMMCLWRWCACWCGRLRL